MLPQLSGETAATFSQHRGLGGGVRQGWMRGKQPRGKGRPMDEPAQGCLLQCSIRLGYPPQEQQRYQQPVCLQCLPYEVNTFGKFVYTTCPRACYKNPGQRLKNVRQGRTIAIWENHKCTPSDTVYKVNVPIFWFLLHYGKKPLVQPWSPQVTGKGNNSCL